MKLQGVTIKNAKSFRDEIKFTFDEKFNILIGPNGSGKSNLLDIITISLRYFFLQPFTVNENPPGMNQLSIKTINQSINTEQFKKDLDKHIESKNKPISLIFSFIINDEDIANIKLIKENEKLITEIYGNQYSGNQYILQKFQLSAWNYDELYSGKILVYEIEEYEIKGYQNNMNPHLQAGMNSTIPLFTDDKKTFLQYLNFFELGLILFKDKEELKLNPNFLFFSPYRNISSEQNLQANLSSQTYNQALQEVHNVNSKKNTNLINIASIYFSIKRRKFESNSNIGYQKLWEKDNDVILMSKYLRRLGYDWKLELIDLNRNLYEIKLLRGEQQFFLSQASSGEKEIINYLLGIFALNLKNGLIIIDEPELHLHPQWQNLLLDLFYDLSKTTGNQFIISTHSTIFIKERSLKHLTRLYKEDNSSKAVFFNDASSFKIKDLLHVINSTNNEKIFFANIVVLVEGITDRIVFHKIISDLIIEKKLLVVIEVIDIGGKHNKDKFTDFLESLKIKNYFIADLDYVNEVGSSEIKEFFKVDKVKVDKFAITNKSSQDANTLIDKLDEAILSGSTADLKLFTEYIKSFRKKLRTDLSSEELEMLHKFVLEQKEQKVYLLEKGDIENYFPNKFTKKDLENVINLLFQENYDKWKMTSDFKKLKDIAEDILSKFN